MNRAKALTVLLFVGAMLPAVAPGQTPPRQYSAPSQLHPAAMALAPSYNSLYCAGFFSERPLEDGLFIMAGVEAGIKNQFIPGDVVFLNKGAGWITNPSGEYMVLRKVRDLVLQEMFPGHRKLVEKMGQAYAEVGRVRVNIVHDKRATAEVLHACEDLTVGDFLIPFNVKAAPPLKSSVGFDRFAPPSGKTHGQIVYGREFTTTARTGDSVYLDIGGNENVVVGQYYRIFRPFDTYGRDNTWRTMQHQLEHGMGGIRLGYRLSREEQLTMPRDVLGEMVITHVEGRSATALITFSQKEVFVGDFVELQ